MIGVYCITSPSGKVYIGQSWDIKKRHSYYTNWKNCIDQPGLSRSIKKYGWDNHSKTVLIELKGDVNQSDLDYYEIYYIKQFKDAGIVMLNVKGGGSNGKHSQETINILKTKRKLQSPPTLGKKYSDDSRAKMSEWQRGRKMSQESIEKSRLKNIGRKASEETRAKLRLVRATNNTWIGRSHTDESRKKQSVAKIGNKCHARKIIRIDTNQVFQSIDDAAKSIGIKSKTLGARLRTLSKKEPIFKYYV